MCDGVRLRQRPGRFDAALGELHMGVWFKVTGARALFRSTVPTPYILGGGNCIVAVRILGARHWSRWSNVPVM